MAISRLEFMDKVGAKMTNHQWSWVGIDHNNKRVYFSTWVHYQTPNYTSANREYLVFATKWGGDESGKKSVGHNDAKKALNLISNDGYEARLLMMEATVKFSYPDRLEGEEVKIKNIRGTQFFTASLNTVNLGEANEMVYARITGKGYTKRPDDIELVSE